MDFKSPLQKLLPVPGVEVLTFLLCGDQNAGKSTLLHAFCHETDAGFTRLSSLLPVLASGFTNVRILRAGLPPRDELPFLDTDVARSTVLVTVENFAFFCDEMKLPHATFAEGTCYVLLHLVELGGDHLDRLDAAVREDKGSGRAKDEFDAHLAKALRSSAGLLAESRRSVYFVNARDWSSRPGAQSDVTRRLGYLRSVLGPGHELLVHISRSDECEGVCVPARRLAPPQGGFRVPAEVRDEVEP